MQFTKFSKIDDFFEGIKIIRFKKQLYLYLESLFNYLNRRMTFKEQIELGIPDELPLKRAYDISINHAPKRKEILSKAETELALRNALRYFDKNIMRYYFLSLQKN